MSESRPFSGKAVAARRRIEVDFCPNADTRLLIYAVMHNASLAC
jgi:hypothetical protein